MITGQALRHEMLSRVYKGTATPRDQGPGAVYRGAFLPLVVFGFFINRTLFQILRACLVTTRIALATPLYQT
jgi:hypothetical protein